MAGVPGGPGMNTALVVVGGGSLTAALIYVSGTLFICPSFDLFSLE